MKKWKIALAAACVCFLFTVAYAANAGSADDPLVTRSYLNGPFLEQVQALVDETVDGRKEELEQAAGQNGGTSGGSVFTVVTLSRGETLVGDVGCEVMLRVGTAVCGASDGVGLIDTTAGTTLGSGGSLVTNHLYMVTISTRSVTATSATVKVLARGPYIVR